MGTEKLAWQLLYALHYFLFGLLERRAMMTGGRGVYSAIAELMANGEARKCALVSLAIHSHATSFFGDSRRDRHLLPDKLQAMLFAQGNL